MNQEEIFECQRNPGWSDAAELRRWDDLAKDPDAEVPKLDAYGGVLRRVVSDHLENEALSRQKGSGFGTDGAE